MKGEWQMDAIATRSREMLPRLVDLDRRVADALGTRSLPDLNKAYEALAARASESEAHLEAGNEACGCDVALSNLVIVVGFAINKLDGAGRYQDWMRGESLGLLQDYHSLAEACAEDSGRARFVSRIRPELIETL
jgi:hypothetical protein